MEERTLFDFLNNFSPFYEIFHPKKMKYCRICVASPVSATVVNEIFTSVLTTTTKHQLILSFSSIYFKILREKSFNQQIVLEATNSNHSCHDPASPTLSQSHCEISFLHFLKIINKLATNMCPCPQILWPCKSNKTELEQTHLHWK